MKKKILFINKSFELGGIQMALANLLEEIADEYEISLAIFNPRGPMLERVPENVKLLKLSPLVEVLGMTANDCKKYGSLAQKVFKIIGAAWSKLFGNSLPVAFAYMFQKHLGEYDVVVSYHQETNSKTLVTGFGKMALEKCAARSRIAWVHADFLATNLATKRNEKTYSKFDKIVNVSKTAMENFVKAYPSLADKCDYCYNCIPVADIIEKSNQEKNVFNKQQGDIILFSACRIVPEKGLIPAVNNLAPLFKEKKNLKWYIAGTGPEEAALKSVISESQLEDQVIMLGFKQNPYPYIREADYLFLPSLHETFSMVAGEAAVFNTSVIASDIPIMREVLGEDDILCADGDYLGSLEKIINNYEDGMHRSNSKKPVDWREQFERVLKC